MELCKFYILLANCDTKSSHTIKYIIPRIMLFQLKEMALYKIHDIQLLREPTELWE